MRCLSLTQPWASLVAIGAKTIETRSWGTPYRGLLAIHAAQRFPREAQDLCYEEPFRGVIRQLLSEISLGAGGLGAVFPRGQVVAVVRLVECKPTGTTLEYYPFAPDWLPREDTSEYAFGDFSPGRWGWVLELVKRLEEPVPAKGALGLWEWEPPAGLLESLGLVGG